MNYQPGNYHQQSARTKRKPRPTNADRILADPVIRRSLESSRALARQQDEILFARLVKRLDGRRPRKSAPRLQRFHAKVYRDPVLVIERFLRRFTQGPWHRGGHHVARYHGGPGIGFRNFRNDRRNQLRPITLNF